MSTKEKYDWFLTPKEKPKLKIYSSVAPKSYVERVIFDSHLYNIKVFEDIKIKP